MLWRTLFSDVITCHLFIFNLQLQDMILQEFVDFCRTLHFFPKSVYSLCTIFLIVMTHVYKIVRALGILQNDLADFLFSILHSRTVFGREMDVT